MKLIEFITMTIILTLIFIGVYSVWTNLNNETIKFQSYQNKVSKGLTEKSTQFYPNMRYPEKEIRYHLSNNCSQKKQKDFKKAITILESKTILNFEQSNKPEILISCSNISPKPKQKNHFIAGEGGPTTIINSSRYAIILLGEIALYRPETCDSPQIAIHEILHSLGFNHNNNTKSIMYPITNCEQTIDKNILNEINRLYSQTSRGDLEIKTLTANKTGKYLNFDISISNAGLKKMNESNLLLIIKNKTIKKFKIKKLDIGARRLLSVQYLRIPGNTKEITFLIETSEIEITKENNKVKIGLLPTS